MSKIITEQLIKEIVSNNEKCTYLNNDYVILYKTMEVPDKQLEEYLENINKAQASGINIPKVLDFKLLPESVGAASKGIFIEERARGTVLKIRGDVLRDSQDYDFENIISIYLEKVSKYIDELEKRANAPQGFYNKFLSDYIDIHKFGLKPDPNSLNYLFDSKIGYTIIDPYPNERNTINEKDLFKYISNAVYGAGRPTILVKKEKLAGFYYLTEQLNNRLKSASSLLNKKISLAFYQNGYSEDYILTGLNQNKMRYKTEEEPLEFEELIKSLKMFLYSDNTIKSNVK